MKIRFSNLFQQLLNMEEVAAIYHPTKDLLTQYQTKNFEKFKDEFVALRDQVEAEITNR